MPLNSLHCCASKKVFFIAVSILHTAVLVLTFF